MCRHFQSSTVLVSPLVCYKSVLTAASVCLIVAPLAGVDFGKCNSLLMPHLCILTTDVRQSHIMCTSRMPAVAVVDCNAAGPPGNPPISSAARLVACQSAPQHEGQGRMD